MKRTLGLLLGLLVAMPFGTSAVASSSGAITIVGDSDFTPIGSHTGCACVTSGSGTATDPFLIEKLTIMVGATPGVAISGTHASFDLDHLTIHTTDQAPAIAFTNVTGPASITHVNIDSPGTIAAGSGNPNGMGIELIDSRNVAIRGDSINTLSSWGIRVSGGSGNTIEFMTVNHTGLATPDSTSSAGLPASQNPFVTGLSGQAEGGVQLINTSGNTVHDNLFNEDAYAGLQLFNANGNTVSRIIVRYPDYFGIDLESSSANTLDNVNLQTADFDGLLVRGGRGNVVKNSNFSANGPIGNEWAAGVVPWFIAGAYFGSGTSGNVIVGNNGNFGNTGPDLEIDNGAVPTPVPGGSFGPQTNNPLNGPGGSDPGGSFVAGKQKTICGNSFAPLYWFPLSLNANDPC